jgi:phosphoserine phosphatase RsbU/P
MLHELLGLFATTEVFIYVFMEVIVKIKSVERVIFHRATWYENGIFILIFGAFSIFGTLTAIPLPSGALSSIRDLGPMIAGLVGGPIVGLGAGLIGGVHRFFLGGITAIPCGLATILAGVLGGCVYLLNKKKLLGVFLSMVLAVGIEILHGLIALAIARPFDEVMVVVTTAIPAMMIANGFGAAICIITLEHVHDTARHKQQSQA